MFLLLPTRQWQNLLRDADEYFKLVHPKDVLGWDRAVAESVAALRPLRWEGRHRLADGQLRWLPISSQPERTPDGDTLWDGVMLDVTERKRAENRLRMLEISIDNANDAILITEAEPTDLPGPRIRYVNCAFTRMSGYTEEEVLGQTPRMFQGPKTDPETTRKIREALKGWQPIRVELINSRRLDPQLQGESRRFLTVARPVPRIIVNVVVHVVHAYGPGLGITTSPGLGSWFSSGTA